MLQKIESAFPKTFTAVSTEGTKVEDSATFFEERKAEIVTFVQEFRATLIRNSAERVWKPTVLWGCLAEPSVEKDVADAILTHVFQQPPDAGFQPSKLSDPLAQEAWDLLCRINVIQPDIHAARRQHIPVAGRMSKDKKTEERRASLKRTSVTCKRITEMALASAAKNYTRQGMEAVRLARRPEAIT